MTKSTVAFAVLQMRSSRSQISLYCATAHARLCASICTGRNARLL